MVSGARIGKKGCLRASPEADRGPRIHQKTARNVVRRWVAVSGGFLAVFWQFLDGLGRQSWAKEMLPGLKMSAKSLSL